MGLAFFVEENQEQEVQPSVPEQEPVKSKAKKAKDEDEVKSDE